MNRADGVSVITGPELRTIILGFNFNEKLHSSNIQDKNPLTDVQGTACDEPSYQHGPDS